MCLLCLLFSCDSTIHQSKKSLLSSCFRCCCCCTQSTLCLLHLICNGNRACLLQADRERLDSYPSASPWLQTTPKKHPSTSRRPRHDANTKRQSSRCIWHVPQARRAIRITHQLPEACRMEEESPPCRDAEAMAANTGRWLRWRERCQSRDQNWGWVNYRGCDLLHEGGTCRSVHNVLFKSTRTSLLSSTRALGTMDSMPAMSWPERHLLSNMRVKR